MSEVKEFGDEVSITISKSELEDLMKNAVKQAMIELTSHSTYTGYLEYPQAEFSKFACST